MSQFSSSSRRLNQSGRWLDHRYRTASAPQRTLTVLSERAGLRWLIIAVLVLGAVVAGLGPVGDYASAQQPPPSTTGRPEALQPPVVPDRVAPITRPEGPSTAITDPDAPEAQFNLDLGDTVVEPSQSLTILVLLTLLSLAPSLLMMMTAFTRIVIVLSITRNAIGLPTVPPNQVVVGLALFLTFFVMGPTFNEVNDTALQPLLNSEISTAEALERGQKPVHDFMMGQVGADELALFINISGAERPENPEDVALTTLIPAFILSEIKAAFIIGFVVFIPFLIVDLITASTLMSMGMMMLPPVLISLPFKLLLFILVDGWTLVVQSLLDSFA